MLRSFVFLAGLLLSTAAQKPTISVYVGGANGTAPTKINMRYNVAMNQTVISSHDFNCTEANGCTTNSVSNTITLGDSSYQYYTAYLSVNLINSQFNGTMPVVYIFNDTNKVGSVLGLSENSQFLTYYFAQNQQAGYSVAFNLDSKGILDFHTYAQENYTNVGAGPFYVDAVSLHSDELNLANSKLCVSNTIDDDAGNSSIIGVSAKNYTAWYNFFQKYYNVNLNDASKNYFYITLTDMNRNFVAQLNYLFSDFMKSTNSNNAPASFIRSVPDNYAVWRGCDLFTGSLMLQKFDWHLVYAEKPNGFDYYYMVKAPKMLIAPPAPAANGGVSGWVILLVLIILGVAGYFVYQWYLQKQQNEAVHNDGYQSLNIPPVEMGEVQRANPLGQNN